MSLYFHKQKAKTAAAKRPPMGAPRSARANVAALWRAGCGACPLNKAPVHTPKMLPTLSDGPIYFLAEAPGEHEDETSHKPLTGPSGTLLRQCIPSGSLDLVSFDNVVNCRPPKNRTPLWNEVECCRPRRVKWIEEVKPKLIVGLGAVPLHWALGSTDLSGMRGRLFAIKVGSHACWFMPTYHPAYILRTAYDKRQPLRSRYGHCLKLDVQKAFAAVDGLTAPHVASDAEIKSNISTFDGSGAGSFERLCQALDHARKAKVKAIDIETVGLRPFGDRADIVSVAISFEQSTVAFALNHPQAKWTKPQSDELIVYLRQALRDSTTKIAHNAPFEIEWFIWLCGREVVNHAAWECTQMQAHFLDERRGRQSHGEDDHRAPYQGLDFLVKQHFGFNFKKLFKVNKKDMSKSDLAETLLYNGVDAKYTLRLWQRQTKLLKEQGLHDAYLEALPRQPTVALMQSLGVDVDQHEVHWQQKKLGAEVAAIEAEIHELPAVNEFTVNHKNGFNPLSTDDVIQIFIDLGYEKILLVKPKKFLDFGVAAETKKKVIEGSAPVYSVDKKVLEQIDHPLSPLIIDLRNRTKLKSTYLDGLEVGKGKLIYPDGKLHTNFNSTFTETGRLSSDGPNLQNWPQRNDAWVRKPVVAPKGYVLVAFDYSQLEGCTSAICSKDKLLVQAFWDDYDIHLEWARRVSEKYPAIGSIDKSLRSKIKNKFVFPAIFGAQNKSIAGYLGIPEDIIDDLMDTFWMQFSGLKSWQDSTMKDYYEKGYVESPTGRRHRYPLTRNQVINFPIQSVACDIVCAAMNELSYLAVDTSQWHLHPVLNVHDDLTFCVPDDDKILEEAITMIYREMLVKRYPFVNVPIGVKCSVGVNWYQMDEIGQFWSHRDL